MSLRSPRNYSVAQVNTKASPKSRTPDAGVGKI